MAVTRDRYVLDVDTKGATTAISNFRGALKGIGFAAAGAAAVAFGRTILQNSKDFQRYRNQLRLITDGQEELAETFDLLRASALRTRTDFGATVELFSKLTIATREMGASQEDVVRVTENLSRALAVAGADTATTNSVIRQFGQAMASGTVRGDEFNSLVEGLGPALAIMAQETGITVGELRRMSQAGELTAQVMFDMINNSDALNASFNRMAVTTEQVETRLRNAFGMFLDDVDDAIGLTSQYNRDLTKLARLLEMISGEDDALVNLLPEEIVAGVENGTIRLSDAVRELTERYESFSAPTFIADYLGITDAVTKTGEAQRLLYERQEALQRQMEAVREEAQAQARAAAEAAAALGINAAATEQLTLAQVALRTTLEDTESQNDRLGTLIQEVAGKYTLQQTAAQTLTQAIEFFNAQLAANNITAQEHAFYMEELELRQRALSGVTDDTTSSLQTFESFMSDLRKSTQEAVHESELQQQAIQVLREELEAGTISTEFFNEAIQRLGQSQRDNSNEIQTYTEYMTDLRNRIEESVRTDDFKRQALASLSEEMQNGVISVQEYDAAVRMLGEAQLSSAERARELQESLQNMQDAATNAVDAANARIRSAEEQSALSGLTGLERDLERIRLEEERLAEAARERVRAQFTEGADSSALETELGRIDEAMQRSIQQRQEAARTIEENTQRIEEAQRRQREATELNQRSFADGWREAFEDYERSARVSGETGLRVFGQVTRGLEDLIVDFAKTGKFEWKEFTASIVEELLRQNVRQVIASTLSGGDPRGIQNLIAGLPGAAGNEEAQQFGRQITELLGQMGGTAELGASASNPLYVQMVNFAEGALPVSGANLTPRILPQVLNEPVQGQSVTYNINAVDAASFKQMIARDPEFIHAVAMTGASRIPGGRLV